MDETPISPKSDAGSENLSSSQNELLESLRAELAGKAKTSNKPLFKIPWGLLGLIFGGVILLGLTIYLVITFFFANKATLEVAVTPSSVSLVVDQKKPTTIDQTMSLKLSAGNHKLLFSKDGYISEEREVSLNKGQTNSLVVALRAISSIQTSIANAQVQFAAVSRDGKSLSYYDAGAGVFRKWLISENQVVPLFDRAIKNVQDVVWSPDGSAVIVKLQGRVSLPNMVDNSNVPGAFSQVGDRPSLGKALSAGVTNFLLDNERRTAAGFQPVKLSDGIRGVSFSPAGDQIAYFYNSAAGEKSVMIAGRDGGEWQRIITDGLSTFINPQIAWSPDSKYLLLYGATDPNQNRFLISLPDNTIVQVTTGSGSNLVPQWAPSGHLFAYQNGNKLDIWDADNSKLLIEVDLGTDQAAWTWKNDEELVAFAQNNLSAITLDGKKQPIPFIAQTVPQVPDNLLYARTARELFFVYSDKVLSLGL